VFRIPRREAARFREGRVFLLGDAAHIHSPVGGQGMNMGIQDAFNLAWKLSLVLRKGNNPRLLDSYEAERKPVDEAVIRQTDRATRLISLHGAVTSFVRDNLMSLLTRIPAVAEKFGEAISACCQLPAQSDRRGSRRWSGRTRCRRPGARRLGR
jgi:2-polyprenyl-6-methoxyphenol hydroxylase-like FAD-dependent oxidoreductase